MHCHCQLSLCTILIGSLQNFYQLLSAVCLAHHHTDLLLLNFHSVSVFIHLLLFAHILFCPHYSLQKMSVLEMCPTCLSLPVKGPKGQQHIFTAIDIVIKQSISPPFNKYDTRCPGTMENPWLCYKRLASIRKVIPAVFA